MGEQLIYQIGEYYIEYTYVIVDIIYVNIIDGNVVDQVGFDVKYHMIVNE